MIEEQMQVLVTVKAYPQPSRTYGETVRIAGVRTDTSEPTWIRLYPVAYRELAFADRFQKYQLMNLRVFRSASDQRPESYKEQCLKPVDPPGRARARRRCTFPGD